MNPVGRHAFWNAPGIMPRSLRAEPIRMGGRFIGVGGGPFMGQVPESLESLPVTAIQNRILATPLVEKFQAEISQFGNSRGRGPVPPPFDRILSSRPFFPELSEQEKALIAGLSRNPSSKDLDDLSLIDGFFGVAPGSSEYRREKPLTAQLCDFMGKGVGVGMGRGGGQLTAAQAIWSWMSYVPTGRGMKRPVDPDLIEEIRKNPFFCGTAREFPDVVYGRDKSDYAGWFGIDANQTWGAVRTQVLNALTVMDVASRYPFPPPIDMENDAPFWILSIAEIQEIVRTPAPVDPEMVRYWITMTVIANYSSWVDRIERDQKKKAKKARRKMIMTAIGLAVASILAAFLLPAVIALAATAIKVGIQAYTDAQKRKKAARDMADAAKMFEADAPGFSKEVDHAAQMLDDQAAKEQASAAPSPELQAAILEVKADTGSGLLLPVGGGIAAAALAAFLIFR